MKKIAWVLLILTVLALGSAIFSVSQNVADPTGTMSTTWPNPDET